MTDERREAIREYLAKLYEKHGRLTPALVVKSAKSPTSVLHDQFEWDDTVAGAKWREEQARVLIRSIQVTITTDTSIIETVAYVRDPEAATVEQGYVSVEDLQGDRKAAKQAIIYECGRAIAMLDRARDLAFALGLGPVAEKALAGVHTLREHALAKAS